MKRIFVTLALLVVPAGVALAAPGDPRVVQGSLEWPATLAAEPFVVVRGEDGRLYYVDVASAQRRVPGTLTAGTRMAVLGVEGTRPHELAAIAFGPGEAAALGLHPSGGAPGPSASLPSVAPPPAPSAEPMWRVDGTVQTVAGNLVTIRTEAGRQQQVDMSELSPNTVRGLRSGDRVSLFGTPRHDRRLIANGFVQTEAEVPAASPRTTR
jgi:hypothetical protein